MNRERLRRGILIAVLGLACGYGAFALYRGGGGSTDRGPHGVVPEIPPSYRVEKLGEIEPRAAWAALRDLLSTSHQAAVVYTDENLETVLLADRDAALLDERILASSGTLRRVLWRGDPVSRLSAAVDSGSLRVAGMPEPEHRNLYH